MWRVAGDHWDDWSLRDQPGVGTKEVIGMSEGMSRYSGKAGGWNDLDYLYTGLKTQQQSRHMADGQTENEYRTAFSFWCLLQSPIIFTVDVRQLFPWQIHVLSNRELLRINQDVCDDAVQGDLLLRNEPLICPGK